MLLDFKKTCQLLKKYNLPFVETFSVKTTEEGIELAQKTGWPIVLKLFSQDNLHKIDKGLVKLNLKNEDDFRQAWREISCQKKQDDQILLQKQITGIEIFVGAKNDKTFGPVVMCGLGGIFVEIIKDIVFEICPLNKNQAIAMIKKIKGYKIFDGYRGGAKININQLAEILVNVSLLAKEINFQEIDFNPLIANEKEIKIVDAKIIV